MKRIISIIIVTVMLLAVATMSAGAMIAPYYYGEVNLDYEINVLDATEIQLYLADLVTLSPLSEELADVDGDMRVTVLDASMIQMYSAKLIDKFDRNPNSLYALISLMRVGANFDSGKAMVGVPVTFTPYANVYSENEKAQAQYKITFLEDSVADVGTVLEGDVMTYTFDTAGVYKLELTAYNKLGTVETHCFDYEVTDKVSDELMVSAVYVHNMNLTDRDNPIFTAHAYGGEAPYEYRFVNSNGGSELQGYSENNEYRETQDGFYPTVVVYVKDANGNVAVSSPYLYDIYDAVP